MTKDLQDRAVSNEQEYFSNLIRKGRFDLKPAIDWIKLSFQSNSSLHPFTSFLQGIPSGNTILMIAFVNLISPSSFIQFPETFRFDILRLTGSRKDFKDLISIQLCLLLYRELTISLSTASAPPSDSSFTTLRLKIWSLLCDLPDDTKFSDTSLCLANEIALHAVQHRQPTAVVPPSHLVNLSQRWIEINVADTASKLFSLGEKRVQDFIVEHLVSAETCCLAQTPLRDCPCEGKIVWAIGTEAAMWLLGERIHRVARFHWAVFGDIYCKCAQSDRVRY